MRALHCIIIVLAITACAQENNKIKPIGKSACENSIKPDLGSDIDLSIYIENSSSMDGYYDSDKHTDFIEVLQGLILRKNYTGTDNHYLINKKQHPINLHPYELVKQLHPDSEIYKAGDRSKTNINDIVRIITEDTKKNEVKILVSDCIYSLGKGDGLVGKLQTQGNITEDFFGSILDSVKMEVLFMHLESTFNGIYYDINNKRYQVDTIRPYYILVLGHENAINKFLSKFDLNEFYDKGLKNYVLFEKENDFPENVCSQISGVPICGEYRKDIGDQSKLIDVKSGSCLDAVENSVMFTTKLNLDNFRGVTSQLSNPNNYRIKTESNIDAQLVSITELDRDNPRNKNFTHQARLRFNRILKSNNSLEWIPVNPNWISEISTLDDTHFDTDKDVQSQTFGIEFFYSAISNAYESKYGKKENCELFKFNVQP